MQYSSRNDETSSQKKIHDQKRHEDTYLDPKNFYEVNNPDTLEQTNENSSPF